MNECGNRLTSNSCKSISHFTVHRIFYRFSSIFKNQLTFGLSYSLVAQITIWYCQNLPMQDPNFETRQIFDDSSLSYVNRSMIFAERMFNILSRYLQKFVQKKVCVPNGFSVLKTKSTKNRSHIVNKSIKQTKISTRLYLLTKTNVIVSEADCFSYKTMLWIYNNIINVRIVVAHSLLCLFTS